MATTIKPKAKSYVRFSASDRMEHFALLISFTMLGLTGLPQRYAEYEIAKDIISIMGGIESVRIMHRFFATLLMATSIYHGGTLSYKLYVKRVQWTMIPSLRDMRDALHVLFYNLGLRKDHPKLPRYNFGEKAEYLAVVWGTVLMVVTGFMLWNPVATAKWLPGDFIPASRIAHSAEAALAIAAIVIWHMYNVHIKRFNPAMFTGKLPLDAMEEEHGEELEAIEKGIVPPPPPAELTQKRAKRFYIYATFMTIFLVGGLIFFVTFEDTAIATISRQPPNQVNEIDPTIGDETRGAELWTQLKCSECHGEQGEGVYPIPALRSTELGIQPFAIGTRRGPADMPAYPVSELSDQGIADLYAYLTRQ